PAGGARSPPGSRGELALLRPGVQPPGAEAGSARGLGAGPRPPAPGRGRGAGGRTAAAKAPRPRKRPGPGAARPGGGRPEVIVRPSIFWPLVPSVPHLDCGVTATSVREG